jgi:hypothetical protein
MKNPASFRVTGDLLFDIARAALAGNCQPLVACRFVRGSFVFKTSSYFIKCCCILTNSKIYSTLEELYADTNQSPGFI